MRENFSIHGISDFLNQIIVWAKENKSILGLALVGSYARNQARKDSDIDLVILISDSAKYILNYEWVKQFGDIEKIRQVNYGAVTSWHVHYKNAYEVEFGITSPSWADIPAEQGTREVVTDGIVILFDPKELLSKLMASL